MITHYLTVTKALPLIVKFNKTANNRFLLYFRSIKDAETFIRERIFVDKIIRKTFNLYFASL